MIKLEWFQRQFTFGFPPGMLPFFLERLEGTAARLEKKISGLPETDVSIKLNGKWSVKENIAHLAEVDAIALKRIDEMINGISPMSPAVVQPGRDYNLLPIHEVLALFREGRAKNLQKYKVLTSDLLQLSSLHPRLKVLMTPVDLAWFDAEHDDHHLVTINEIIKSLNHKTAL
jgi:hypothetical protein